jgi:hypothetical protein
MTVKEGNMPGEAVLFSIGGDRLLGLKAAGAVPPSVLAGAARAEVGPALRGQSWRVARVDQTDGIENGEEERN